MHCICTLGYIPQIYSTIYTTRYEQPILHKIYALYSPYTLQVHTTDRYYIYTLIQINSKSYGAQEFRAC